MSAAHSVGSTLRTYQRKLHKFVKDLQKLENVREILAEVPERSPCMQLFFDHAAVDAYGDDIHQVKKDLDACVKSFSKLRGRRLQTQELATQFDSLLRETFPEIFPSVEEEVIEMSSNRKRSRTEETPEVVEAPEKKRPTKKEEITDKLTAEEKSQLKQIINSISKNPLAEAFLYPVDRKAFPEYYDMITNPMDLATMKTKLNSYSTVEEALEDLQTIWKNCRNFNEDGSEIIQAVNKLSNEADALVVEKLGEQYLPRKRKLSKSIDSKPNGKSGTESNKVLKTKSNEEFTSLIKQDIKLLIKEMSQHPYAAPFMHPVNEDEAPGYFEVIKTPMDLSTVKKNLSAGVYDTAPALFVEHMRLIPTNCLAYNLPDSELAEWAETFSKDFQSSLSNMLSQKSVAKTLSSKKEKSEEVKLTASKSIEVNKSDKQKTSSKSVAAEQLTTLSALKNNELKHLLKTMHENPFAAPFMHPVNEDEAPGYFEVIKTPMDLSTIKKNLSAGVYDTAPVLFVEHMRLIPTNCLAYNLPDSELAEWAETFSKDFESSLAALLAKIKPTSKKSLPDIKTVKQNEVAKSTSETAKAVADTNLADTKAQNKTSRKKETSITTKSVESNLPMKEEIKPSTVEISESATISQAKKNKKKDFVVTTDSVNYLRTQPILSKQSYQKVDTDPSTSKINYQQPKTLKECQGLLSMLASYSGSTHPRVREIVFKKSREILHKTKFPYVVAPGLYEVRKIGELPESNNFGTYEHLYPVGYTCARTMKIVLETASGVGETALHPFVPVNVVSSISSVVEDTEVHPIFQVSIEGGALISEGDTPKEAWKRVIGTELLVLQTLGSKLQRCRAVFNRLSSSPDAIPFLEKIPMNDEIAADYYAMIKSPMWLREVHSRLMDGAYDNEYDFAWDVRLIFKNCMNFNKAGSKVYDMAVRMSKLFEHLMVYWVYNVRDKSIYDRAKGFWDNWMTLRYFDNPLQNGAICAASGAVANESDLVKCAYCEDQYLPHTLGLPQSIIKRVTWACPRCKTAMEQSDGSLSGEPYVGLGSQAISIVGGQYLAEELGGTCYVPIDEYGSGWCQGRRRNRGGLKNLYLSPLGYEVYSKEEIDAQTEYEKQVDAELMSAREKEFKDSESHSSSSKKRSKRSRHKRKKPVKVNSDDGLHTSIDSNTSLGVDIGFEEDGRIPFGKLYNFAIPAGCSLVWRTCEDENDILDKIRSDPTATDLLTFRANLQSTLPESGYFGLDIPEIKRRIEGLPFAENFNSYKLFDEIQAQDLFRDEVTCIMKGLIALDTIKVKLNSALLEERWFWPKVRMDPLQFLPTEDIMRSADSDSELRAAWKSNFTTLFPDSIENGEKERILAIWDFLDNFKYTTGTPTFTLYDIVRAVYPPDSPFTTLGQVVFDELCNQFTRVLFREIKSRIDVDDFRWQQILMTRPFNLITWPRVLLESLHLLSFPYSPSEAVLVLDRNVGGELAVVMDILLLLYNHPLADFLISLDDDGHSLIGPIKADVLNRIEHFNEETNEQPSATAIISSIVNIIKSTLSDPATANNANALLQWLKGVIDRFAQTFRLPELVVVNSLIDMTLDFEESDLVFAGSRSYGSYILSNCSTASDQVLTPFSLSLSVSSELRKKMDSLHCLERTLMLLRSSDSENWDKIDRFSVIMCIIDHCIVTTGFMKIIVARNQKVVSKFSDFGGFATDKLADLPSNIQRLDVCPKSAICIISGISAEETGDDLKWVVLPTDFPLKPRLIENDQNTESDHKALNGDSIDAILGRRSSKRSQDDSRRYALELAVQKVLSLRKDAAEEQKRYDAYVDTLMQSILYSRGIVPVQDYEGLRPNLKRSVPVGFDRFGNSYWILGAQETMTLFPFNGSGTAVAPVANTTVNVLEPCVLMRDTRGWWGYYSGRNIVEFFNSFSSDIACESVLKGLLVVKYSFALRMLKTSTLKIKAFQQDWYTRRVRSEPWVNQYRWRDDLPKEEKVRLLEVCWARSAEVRMYSHYAFLNSDGDDLAFKGVSRAERDAEQRRVKKLKELLEGALPDHHPTHGWLRYDKLTRLLDLSCMTTSTRLLADASIYRLLQFHLQSSPYLKKRPLAKVSEVVEDQEVIREAEGNQSIDNKSAAVIASYNGDKGTNMEIDQGEGQSVLVLTSEMKETGTFPRNPSSVMSSSTEKQRSSEENVANVVLGSQSETNNDSTIESGKTDDAIDKVPSPSPAARTTGDNPRRSSFVKTPKPRAVEQLHLLTGEVLRVYPAGKDAAQFMGISQSGISLCCTGIKSDSNGFKWRLRDGPIDFAELEGKQKTYEELIEIAKRAKMMESERKNQEAVRLRLKKQAESASIALVTASAVVPSQPGNNGSAPVLGEQLNYVPSVPVKEQIPLTVSTNVTSARLIKLKAELINILCILPEKSLLWPELSEEEKDEIEKAGLESANSTFQLNQEALKDDYDAVKAAVLERISDAAKKDSAGENPPEDEPISSNIHPLFDTVLKQVEKAVKKTTRRMRRKLSMDKFLVAVQSAESPNELLEQVKALENIIPIEYLFDHDTGNLPTHATTCADVAIRLYTLDRSISFHDIKGVEEAAAVCPYKVRTEFCARCYATSNCFGFIGHATKCTTRIDAESRYPNLRDPVKTHPFSNNVVDIKARYNFTPSSQYAPQVPYKKPLQPLSSFEVKRNGMTAYGEVDIELVLPYVPTAHECLKIESI